MFAHACCVTTHVTAGVGGGGLALWLRFQKSGKKKTNNPALDNDADVLSCVSWKKERKFRKFTSPIRTPLAMILPCRCGALTSLIIRKRYTLRNTTGDVMWSCKVTTIEHEGEKCKSSVFRKERLVYLRYFISHTSFGISWEAIIQTVSTKYPT